MGALVGPAPYGSVAGVSPAWCPMTNKQPDSPGSKPEAATQPTQPASTSWVDIMVRVMERWVPDALTTAVALMVSLVAMSLMFGATVTQTVDAYYQGLWMFLRFTMQMTLILVLSLVLAATPVFRLVVMRVAKIPTTRTQVVVMASLTLGCIAYLNWGLSLALGPMIAIHYCREAERKGIAVDFLFLMATLAGVGSIWQFGLSASPVDHGDSRPRDCSGCRTDATEHDDLVRCRTGARRSIFIGHHHCWMLADAQKDPTDLGIP